MAMEGAAFPLAAQPDMARAAQKDQHVIEEVHMEVQEIARRVLLQWPWAGGERGNNDKARQSRKESHQAL
eukprot:jgi/Pico_ML_1/54024/g445.t1